MERSLESNILAIIADDDALNRMLLYHMLNKFNFEFVFAENGLEVIDILQKNKDKYVCLFLDINMPVMDGIEVLDLLNNDKSGYKGVSVICVSALSYHEFKSKTAHASTCDYLQKPVSQLELESIVKLKILELNFAQN